MESTTAAPHRCPWWIQWVLASPIRALIDGVRGVAATQVQPGMTVLDVGCGFGFLSLPMARRVGPDGRVLAVDVEPRVVDELRRRASRAGLADRINARACDVRDLDLGDRSGAIDLVTVVHCLHEFDDPDGFLVRAASVLRPGGRLLLIEPPGHVTADKFAAQIERALRAGLKRIGHPAVDGRRLTALFERPATTG